MNKSLIAFLCGGVVGAGATYFIVKNKYEKEYSSYRQELLDIYKKTDDDENEDEPEEKEEIINKLNSIVASARNEESREYVEYSRQYGAEEKAKDEPVVDDFPREEDLPYLITEDEYVDPIPSNDKVSLVYYIKDNILVDEMSHEIIDPIDTISAKNIETLCELYNSDEADYIHVRNRDKGTDYEVTVSPIPYLQAEKGYTGIY